MPYLVAAADVHKRMLAVVLTNIEGNGEFQFERRKFGATPDQMHLMAQWMDQKGVDEIVMESTAEYWKPVWAMLERFWKPARQSREGAGPKAGKLYLCQAKSNKGARGRKNDFGDAERMVKRLVAGELILSYVPEPDQRLWRTVTRRQTQLTRARVGFKNQLESLLEQGHIKLTSLVSDLLGVSARRMLKAMAKGESQPAVLAGLADHRLRATPEQLRDALGACQELSGAYRRVLQMTLDELDLLEKHIEALEKEALELMKAHQEQIQRVSEVPGFGLRSAVKMIAEVGPAAASFRSAKALASWVGVCPGNEESAGESQSTRSPKGNREMRRLLNQSAQAAVKVKGSVFAVTFQRLLPRLGYKQAIWAIAHRLCRLLWLILHNGVRYEERGPAVSAKAKQTRTARMIRELRKLGYHIEAGKITAAVVPA